MAAGLPSQAFIEIDSPMTKRAACRRTGEKGPLWLTARRQTAGGDGAGALGQAGRQSCRHAAGSSGPAESEWPQLSFVAAIATADMAASFASERASPSNGPMTSWRTARSFAGILLENAHGALAIGIGVNLKRHPRGTEFPAHLVGGTGHGPAKSG